MPVILLSHLELTTIDKFLTNNSLCLSSIMMSHYTTNFWLCHYIIVAFSIAPSRLYHCVLDSLSENAFLPESIFFTPSTIYQSESISFSAKSPEQGGENHLMIKAIA
jgi:hypothetical protein